MRLLVVEDERRLAERVARGLREEGFAVDVAGDLATARDRAIESEYDLALLDLVLPDGSGLELLAEWRNEGRTTPVLVLTAQDRLEHKVAGLDAGADDYLTKPFEFDELLARVRALLRRRGASERDSPVFEMGEVRVDLTRRVVERGGQPVHLTPIEYRLLSVLIANAGKVLTHRQLLKDVWGPAYVEHSHYLRIYMGQLRHKLERDPARPRHLLTELGVGYRLVAE